MEQCWWQAKRGDCRQGGKGCACGGSRPLKNKIASHQERVPHNGTHIPIWLTFFFLTTKAGDYFLSRCYFWRQNIYTISYRKTVPWHSAGLVFFWLEALVPLLPAAWQARFDEKDAMTVHLAHKIAARVITIKRTAATLSSDLTKLELNPFDKLIW